MNIIKFRTLGALAFGVMSMCALAASQTTQGPTPSTSVGDKIIGHIDATNLQCTEISRIANIVSLTAGLVNGHGLQARFSGPRSITSGSLGDLYVADFDSGNIRRVTQSGDVSDLLAERRRGQPASAYTNSMRIEWPNSITTDSAGNVFVSDVKDNSVKKIDAHGHISVIAKNSAIQEQSHREMNFYLPGALVIDHRGNLFVADAGTRIQKVSPSGNVTTWVGESVGEAAGFDVDGAANVARFGVIMGMTIDDNDTIFIAEGSGTIRRITPDGVVTTLAGKNGQHGSVDAAGAEARFRIPRSIAWDGKQNFYVVDDDKSVRKVSYSGEVKTVVRFSEPDDADFLDYRQYISLYAINIGRDGTINLSDTMRNSIYRLNEDGTVGLIAGADLAEIFKGKKWVESKTQPGSCKLTKLDNGPG